MKGFTLMFTLLTAMLFAAPSFSASPDFTVFYMPVVADITTKDCDSTACGTIELDDSKGMFGAQYGLFTAVKIKTVTAEHGNRSHYGAGFSFNYELTDGMTVFAGASLYSGFEDEEHRYDVLGGQITGLANFGIEAPIYKNLGLRVQVIPNVLTAAGLYAKF